MKKEKDNQKIGKSKGRIIKITILLILIMLLILFFLTKCTGNKSGYSDDSDLETTEDMEQTSEDEQESTEEAIALGDSELNSEDTEDVASEDTTTEDENTEEYTAVDTETYVPSDSDMDEYDNSSLAETTTESSDGTTQHQHTWVAQYTTVHHEEEGHYEDVLVQEAYDEHIYEEHQFCNYCNIDITVTGQSASNHCLSCGPPMDINDPFYEDGATEGSTWGQKDVLVDTIHHDAVYETQLIVDKAAYDEKVLTGYTCTCGATKSN